jgi:4-amino-4-deoxy-L-arabinose transferase-like glycosyltransferase
MSGCRKLLQPSTSCFNSGDLLRHAPQKSFTHQYTSRWLFFPGFKPRSREVLSCVRFRYIRPSARHFIHSLWHPCSAMVVFHEFCRMNFTGIVRKYHRTLFFFAWLIINIIQAATTELFDDEAYYWIYSQYPAWGYFDHPPMIAWLIKAGYSIFPNELGVRLLIVLLNTGTIFLALKLTERKNDLLFYAIAASVAVAQIGGVIAVPDIPLLFFVSLFFWLYKRFLSVPSLANTVFLGISIALMLYSKYHGVLIVLGTLASNPKLFSRYQSYVATLVAILLFAPHLYWQYTHGFPSVQFHLFERNAVSYRFSFTVEYLLGQIAIAGPVIGWLLLWAAFKYRPANLTERAMKFSMIGIYLLFLLSTLKGRVEANWTVPGFIALLVLSHQYLVDRPQWMKWVYRTVPITLLIVFAGRIYMMLDIEPLPFISKDEFHKNRVAAEIVKQKTNGEPLVVIDSYQKPSKHLFYAHQSAFALNTPWYRRNNYNYWPMELPLIGKTVYAVGLDSFPFTEPVAAPGYAKKAGHHFDNYFSFSQIRIQNMRAELVTRDMVQFTCKIETPTSYLPLLQQTPYDTASIVVTLYDQRGNVKSYLGTGFRVSQIRDAVMSTTIRFNHTLPPGKHSVRLGITSRIPGFPSLNSSSFKFLIL